MSTGTELGFNLDEETIELFDAILLNLTQDAELAEEFTKLKFVRKLHDNYDGSKGPIKQIMEKLAKIEKEYHDMVADHIVIETNMRRAIADMTDATRAIRAASTARTATEQYEALKKLEGMEYRQNSYTWNK